MCRIKRNHRQVNASIKSALALCSFFFKNGWSPMRPESGFGIFCLSEVANLVSESFIKFLVVCNM